MMRPVATDVARSVVCVSVCVLGTRMSCAKLAEPIEMLLGDVDSCGSKVPCIRWGSRSTTGGVLMRGDMFKPVVTYLLSGEYACPMHFLYLCEFPGRV